MGEAQTRLPDQLRRLHEAAGRPSYRRLVDLARQQRPPVKLAAATLSEWMSGKAVPSDPAVFRFLVETLEERALRRGPAPTRRPQDWRVWERWRQEAMAERTAAPAAVTIAPTAPPPTAAVTALPVVPPPTAEVTAPPVIPPPAAETAPRRRPYWIAAGIAAGTAAIAGTVLLVGHRPATAHQAAADPAPTVITADGTARAAERLPGPTTWYVAHDVSGPDACPATWACFYQNEDFNRRSAGWMILAQDPNGSESDSYDFTPPYDKAMSSWINNTPLDIAWHAEHHHHGPFFRMDPGARAARLGPAARTASSVHILFDDQAWPRGAKP
ncbi:peptidase inhibitor family I36 protein [Actinoallomurus sp. NPDC050550]|uniref:peptidase inhibitor family I36 protein n=1 Tax=Actinoallomurus sp. NPDC050550 TaxID=3154937 RepID=UPI0033C1DB63